MLTTCNSAFETATFYVCSLHDGGNSSNMVSAGGAEFLNPSRRSAHTGNTLLIKRSLQWSPMRLRSPAASADVTFPRRVLPIHRLIASIEAFFDRFLQVAKSCSLRAEAV